MSPVPRLEPLQQGLVCLGDYEAHARTVMPPAHWAYVNGTAADGITARANRDGWDRVAILPRILRPMAGGHMQVELLGRVLQHPILLGPVAYHRLAHEDGEIATAHAAAAQGAGLVLSTQSSVTLEDVASAVAGESGRGPLWFQLYFKRDRAVTRDLVRRAEAAGYEAIVITADAPVNARDAQRRAAFRLPPGVMSANLTGYPPNEPTGGDLFAQLACAPGWADIEWLRGLTTLPLLLKGVLHPADAREAAAAGLQGVVVSNHGGRTLDTAVSTPWALPRIVEALDGAFPVLVDGGIRRGTDVLKAVALGARAVLVGQPQLWGLAASGATGVAHVLRLLQDELAMAMALAGCRRLDEATRELLQG